MEWDENLQRKTQLSVSKILKLHAWTLQILAQNAQNYK